MPSNHAKQPLPSNHAKFRLMHLLDVGVMTLVLTDGCACKLAPKAHRAIPLGNVCMLQPLLVCNRCVCFT